MTIVSLFGGNCWSQQATISSPAVGIGDHYREHFDVSWGFQQRSPNGMIFFRFGGGPLTPFGGFDSNAQSGFAVGGRLGNAAWDLRVSSSQGSHQSSVALTPGITLANGAFGVLSDSLQRPFATGFQPIIGGRAMVPIEERLFRLRFEAAAKASRGNLDPDQKVAEGVEPAARTPHSPRPDDPPLILHGSSRSAE
jgi:hypothetical protein